MNLRTTPMQCRCRLRFGCTLVPLHVCTSELPLTPVVVPVVALSVLIESCWCLLPTLGARPPLPSPQRTDSFFTVVKNRPHVVLSVRPMASAFRISWCPCRGGSGLIDTRFASIGHVCGVFAPPCPLPSLSSSSDSAILPRLAAWCICFLRFRLVFVVGTATFTLLSLMAPARD